MRPYQLGTAAFFAVVAAVAMIDSRRDALFDPRSPSGVGPGWYPFWSAAILAGAAVVVGYLALRRPQAAEGAFADRQAVNSVQTLVIPMLLYAASFSWLGFYLATAVFMGFFAVRIGHYRWYSSAASALLTPLIIYLTFEMAFKLTLPKSILYSLIGLPF